MQTNQFLSRYKTHDLYHQFFRIVFIRFVFWRSNCQQPKQREEIKRRAVVILRSSPSANKMPRVVNQYLHHSVLCFFATVDVFTVRTTHGRRKSWLYRKYYETERILKQYPTASTSSVGVFQDYNNMTR